MTKVELLSGQDPQQVVEPIAVIGIGGCFPDAANISQFWQNICSGHVAIREVPKDRWDAELYYHPERGQRDKTYSKIGAFIESVPFERKLFRIPPRTLEVIDPIQKLALTSVYAALEDANLQTVSGSEGRSFNRERCSVIVGNSMGGEFNGRTIHRAYFPEVLEALRGTEVWRGLSEAQQAQLSQEFEQAYKAPTPEITEDTMPGELANCIAGRIANVFDLSGHNFTTDAACASSLAAVQAAVYSLRAGDTDLVVAGGADSQMDPPSFIKFSQIGALSGELSAPFDQRASGFVMGEGVGMLVLKRLSDALTDGDRIYAQILGVGAASDGKGKGITAPNPRGQRLAIERAYEQAQVPIESVGLFEAHGTSTPVGDAVEVGVLSECLKNSGASAREVPIGSIKSMIGHLKSAAGVAALIKTTLAIYNRTLPPSANFQKPPVDSPLAQGFLKVNSETRPWQDEAQKRRAGVSAFGFGGTNFHVVLEEAGDSLPRATTIRHSETKAAYEVESKVASASGSASSQGVLKEITDLFAAQTGYDLEDLDPEYQLEADLGIDTVKQAEIFSLIRERYGLVQDESFSLADTPTLRAIADYVAGGTTSGATSQAQSESAPTNVPAPVAGPRVVSFAGKDKGELLAVAKATLSASTSLADMDVDHQQITDKPCRLAFVAEELSGVEKALESAETKRARMLAARGIFLSEKPGLCQDGKVAFLFPGQGSQYLCMFEDLAGRYDVVKETFDEANRILEPLIDKKLTDIVWTHAEDDESKARANAALKQTEITQPAMLTADVAMFRLLAEHGVKPDMVAGHSLGEYGACVAAGVLSFADALYAVSARGREMAGVEVPDTGKMASISGPVEKVDEVLANVSGYVIAANKNCPTQTVIAGESHAVEAAIKEFSTLGVDAQEIPVSHAFHSKIVAPASKPLANVLSGLDIQAPSLPILSNVHADYYPQNKDEIVALLAKQLESPVEYIAQIERMYAEGARVFVEVGPRRASTGFVRSILGKSEYVAIATNHPKKPGVECFLEALACLVSEGYGVSEPGRKVVTPPVAPASGPSKNTPVDLSREERTAPTPQGGSEDAIWISGVSVLSPKSQPVDPMGLDPFADLMSGHNFIESVADENKENLLAKNITRLNKANGVFEPLKALNEVIQLFASVGDINLNSDYGIDDGFVDALDKTSLLAIASGIDALRDAGLPLHRYYRTTSTGKLLPDRWGLPPRLAKRTGIIFASAFPGLDRLIEDVSGHVESQFKGKLSDMLLRVNAGLDSLEEQGGDAQVLRGLVREHLDGLAEDTNPYEFSRKFLFRILSMGHAQLAQVVCAQGPNTQVNGACASGPQAMAIAEDWIRLGRCDRVLVVSADDVANKTMFPWIGAGFLAAGAATIEADVEVAAVPFGAKRNGMLLGSGASAFVVERKDCVDERGMSGVVELLATSMVNSAFHGTRLNAEFIREAFSDIVAEVERKTGISRNEFADRSFFMSHETYTPARGGSSAAEIEALRYAFGEQANKVLIANTKGYTGHPMGASLEDVVAVKGLQRQTLPAIANLNEIDPDFVDLNFSKGGAVDMEYGFRFSAGFGSQIAMTAYGRLAQEEARLISPERYRHWLQTVAGREDAALEIIDRTLRISESGGLEAWELGVPSLVCAESTPVQATPPPLPVAELPQPVVAESAVVNTEGLLRRVQELFARETGYDLEELEPEYQLEADLGIDTVKQAEIFALLREEFSIPSEITFELSEVQTLNAVVAFLENSGGTSAQEPTAPKEKESVEPTQEVSQAESAREGVEVQSGDASGLLKEIQEIFAEQTGYDVEELEPDYQLEADLGIDTVKQAEIFSHIREHYGIPADVTFELSEVQTLHLVANFIGQHRGDGEQVPVEKVPQSSVLPEPVNEEKEPTPEKSSALVAGEGLLEEIQKLFADETGYELEDLEPEHQLEADLGIDTVKQAEVFGILRQRYGLEQEEGFDLASVQTISAVHDYLVSRISGANRADGTREESIEASPSAVESPVREEARVSSAQAGDLLVEITTIFAEQTGYDVDELEPDYELEADLGIDTVKQAEILSLLRERYGFEQDESVELADLQTLHRVTDYVAKRQQSPEVEEEGQSLPQSSVEQEAPRAVTQGSIKAAKVELEELPLILGAARNCRGRRVLLVCAEGDTRQITLTRALESRGADVRVCDDFLSRAPAEWENVVVDATERCVDDVFVLVPEKDEWSASSVSAQIEAVFFLARALARRGDDLADKSFAVLGRSRGVLSSGPLSAQGLFLSGASGILKSIAKEWQAKVLVCDLDFSSAIDDALETGLNEWLSDGPIEIGYIKGKRYTLKDSQTLSLSKGALKSTDLVVATGGARGVTFSILHDLAKRGSFRLVVLGRTRAIALSESPLASMGLSEQKELARASLLSAGEKATPVNIRRWLEKEEQRLEVSKNLDLLRGLGCEVETAICDVSKRGDVQDTVSTISNRYGRVDLLLHGAGLEESKFIQDKDDSAFARVFAPKAQAALLLWEELQPRRMVCMGSVAGRYGNAAQADYAAANNVMSSLAGSEENNVLNIAWTAWGGVGMATRGSIKKVLEDAGVELLPLEIGSSIGADLLASDVKGEVVVAGELGSFAPSDDGGGQKGSTGASGQFFERIGAEAGKTVYCRRFDVHQDPGLDHHRINGVPVLPGVLGIELMVQAAREHFGQDIPELSDIKFSSPLKMFRDEPVDVEVEIAWEESQVVARLISLFKGPKKLLRKEHFSALIHLESTNDEPRVKPSFTQKEFSEITIKQAYERYFHGPRFKVMQDLISWDGNGLVSALAHDRPIWMHKTSHTEFSSAPFMREGAFQTAGLWEMVHYDRMALPFGVKRVMFFPNNAAEGPVYSFIAKTGETENGLIFDLWSIDGSGRIVDYMEGYETVRLRDFAAAECFDRPSREPGTDLHVWQSIQISEAQELQEKGEDELSKFLSSGEREVFSGFTKDKRRDEWLAGRIALKRLLREISFSQKGVILPYTDIVIYNDAAGTPHLDVVGRPELNSASVSISHRMDMATASCILAPGHRVGIDVEFIEEKQSAFLNTYFTAAEQALFDESDNLSYLVNASWAVKEACLKALGIGATIDFRHIEVRHLGGTWWVEFHGDARDKAERLGVTKVDALVEQKDNYVIARITLNVSE